MNKLEREDLRWLIFFYKFFNETKKLKTFLCELIKR